MVQKYIVDEEIIETWTKGNEMLLFETIVSINNLKNARKVVNIITDLAAAEKLDLNIAFESCKTLYQSIQTEDYSDLKVRNTLKLWCPEA
jgi:methionine synthase I (cobalamin-dependent)